MRQLIHLAAAVATALVALAPAFSLDLITTPTGTLLAKTDPPDYGNYGYRYAPTLIRAANGSLQCWFCGGIATRTNPDLSPDHVLFTTNWANPEVVLCPKNEDSRVNNPLCNWLFNEPNPPVRTGDFFNVCDPAVIKVGGQYWMYYTGQPLPLDAEGNAMGGDNQMFLARSNDGRNWVKYPDNAVAAEPVLPFPDPFYYEFQHTKYGIGEGSAIYKDNLFWLYYTYWPYDGGEGNSVYLTKSSDGINFERGAKIFAESTMPFLGQSAGGGIDVKYIPGWDMFFYVAPTASKQDLTWNISRDGVHWLPWDPTKAFGHHERIIPLPRRFAVTPALEGNEFGHIGDGTLASAITTSVSFAAGDTETMSEAFWRWTLDGVNLTLTPQPLSGWLDSINTNKIASGWTYDPDSGTNDTAANGGQSTPLGYDTWVRPVATNVTTGQVFEGQWQGAQVRRDDLVAHSAAPDPYHGYLIDLKLQGFPPGTYNVRMQGGEFPAGMGATELQGQYTATITSPCTGPGIASHSPSLTIRPGGTTHLTASSNGGPALTYVWYVRTGGGNSTPVASGPSMSVSPVTTTEYWVRVHNSCGFSDSTTIRVTVSDESRLYTMTPCRILDTRYAAPVSPYSTLNVQVGGICGIPSDAVAASLNVTSVLPTNSGHLSLYPTDATRTVAIASAYRQGKTRATSAIIKLSRNGMLTIYNKCDDAVNVIIDVSAYFR